jgi:SAM-dependent methyltransferase
MNSTDRFSGRAGCYACHRWDYAAEAVQAVITACSISENSIIADIGSGTGMLTNHFVGRVRTVFAVEPNPDMRSISNHALQAHRSYENINGVSDATTLPDNSVDVITVGRALHWFPPHSTRAEFRRILKPNGTMAVFSVPCTDQALLDSLSTVSVKENGWEAAVHENRVSLARLSFYFGHGNFRKLVIPGLVRETWEAFLQRHISFSIAPKRDHPLWSKFERSLFEVFEKHAVGGVLTISNATQVAFGHVLGL